MPDMNFLYGQGERNKKNSWAVPTQHWIHTRIMLHDFSCWICIAGHGVLVPEPFSFRGAGSKSCQARPVWPCKETGPDVFFFLWKDSVFSLLLPVAFIAHIVHTTQLWLLHARSSLEVPFKLYVVYIHPKGFTSCLGNGRGCLSLCFAFVLTTVWSVTMNGRQNFIQATEPFSWSTEMHCT